ncbi:Os03g0279832, partial [Oryza sativa Japonica Group]
LTTNQIWLVCESKVKLLPSPFLCLQERKCLEEKLYWIRLELQRTIALSADADETICKLSSAARRTMQERDEARSQGKILLAELQARRNAHAMLARRALVSQSASPDAAAFAVHSSCSRALRMGPKPFAGTPQGQRDAPHTEAGCTYRFAGSGGHKNTAASAAAACSTSAVVPSSGHEFACSSQEEDSFDPDMFLVDPSESPQDFAANTSSSGVRDDRQWCVLEQANLQVSNLYSTHKQ